WSAYAFIVAAYSMKMATTIVPRVDGKVVFHDATAVHTGTFLLLLIVSLAFSSTVDGGLLTIVQISIAAMAVFGLLALNRGSPHYLLNQGAFFLIFTMNIIFLTYLAA
ncbi:MAG: hypothetical protein GY954_16570, partial [Alteromonas sp.]|nr:hypothetical protein [Alteromonas sp.]